MAYSIHIEPSAMRALAKVPLPDRLKIKARIDLLAAAPRPPGVVKLSGAENLYRIRVGDYRVVYQILDKVLRVIVIRIGHRGEVYRER